MNISINANSDFDFLRLSDSKNIPSSKFKKLSGATSGASHTSSQSTGHSGGNSHYSSGNSNNSTRSRINLADPSDLMANLNLSEHSPPSAGGSSGSSTSNKNLSHVPCKFYRQGNCQAGAACPFSHNLDGTLAADKLPCKYFQKGNCKFGLKCALAHYLPDGTRVNSKGLLNSTGYSNYRRAGHSNNFGNGNGNSNGNGNGNGNSNGNGNANGNGNGNGNGNASNGNSNNGNGILNGNNGHSNGNSNNSNRSGSGSVSSTITPNLSDINLSHVNSRSASFASINNTTANTMNAINPIDISFSLASDANGSLARSANNYTNSVNSNQLFQQNNHQVQNFKPNPAKSNSFGEHYFSNVLPSSLSQSQSIQNSSQQQVFRSYTTGQVPQVSPNNFSNSSPTNFYFPQQQQTQSQQSPPANDNYNINSRLAFHSRLSSQSSNSFANNNGQSLFNFGNTLSGNGSLQAHSNSQYSPPLYDYNSSAIVDDDDSLHDNSNHPEDDIFEEDYVPASLSDLILTPQELVRRDSRSQSGTLSSRPTLNSIVTTSSSVSSSNDSHINADETTSSSPHHVHHFQNDAFKKKIKGNSADAAANTDDVFLMD